MYRASSGTIEDLLPLAVDGVSRVAAAILSAKNQAGIEAIRRRAQHKADGSPVTELDHLAHKLLVNEITGWPKPLGALTVVSEEDEVLQPPAHVCQSDGLFWLTDPLDGTRDLLAGEQTYAMVVALMEVCANVVRPIFGVIASPEFEGGTTWAGGPSVGLHVRRAGDERLCRVASRGMLGHPVRVLGSRSIPSDKMKQLYGSFGAPSIERLGSAIKFGLIAEGRFDVYPRLGPTSEWDIAAGQAILEATGGTIWSLENKAVMTYGKNAWENSGFLAVGERDQFVGPLEALHAEYIGRRGRT